MTLRNPQTVPFDALQPREVPRDAQGNAISQAEANMAMYEVYASLIAAWHVYDATVEDANQPELPFPATGELFAKLPLEIQSKIADEVNARRNPTTTPSTPNS